ncbi:DUF2461 domain-containing protein [Luteimonas granuli]|uniref:DUF2461 domain-containing protein n=1 Tax=Luteimonas granuli TaxID=1176533 RepID=A0A518N749_9GAMM|nr:DUF2461 domain-containing protein [Luteimonas granuli]QDW67739.1 DUF2461 domain-containing protein [Luteimonas granuli]
MTTYFSDRAFRFLRALARHNERAWFHAHKQDYEAHVRDPLQRLVTDLQPDLAEVSPHFRADPRTVGGSLYRIQRDTRFANDKRPYKTWQGARLFHARRKELASPLFYLHIEPGNCFVAAGLWRPESPTLRQLRQFIVDNPAGWKAAAHAPAFRRRYAMDDEDMLVRPPRGFAADFPFLDDLRRRSFVAWRALDDDIVTGARLREVLAKDLHALAPFMDYLCAALDLEF